ncbi:glutathione S-transferase family protein [Pseudorhodoferax soli]|uniref:GST-like protein n=1 Tax=Pseudorhodoferax soli TaxID=545864 RepID=A0A368X8S2_9BURK|nr:glutathione S-transferase N-terminal domain-containing protein [Pseudorhodoferax soli]RCW63606.1 GST-like protein [Pseudorhodoferax soli]
MIEFYFWPTPNCRKISILLEELQLPFALHRIDIHSGQQKLPQFLEVNPNGRVPAIVDHEPAEGGKVVLAESGAILVYLAGKVEGWLPRKQSDLAEVLQWLFWQMSALGPMQGQASHFLNSASDPCTYARDRFKAEVARLYQVLEDRLATRQYLCRSFGLADIACFPWVSLSARGGIDLSKYPSVSRWMDALSARPAVGRGMVLT